MSTDVKILLSREQSSMASTWTTHLGISHEASDDWRIGTYGYNWLGCIYDLLPEDQRSKCASQALKADLMVVAQVNRMVHMNSYSNDDYETPIEELPGILGYSWDGEFFPLYDALSNLKVIDLRGYSELIEEHRNPRKFPVDFKSGTKDIEVEAYTDIALILDQVPSIDVQQDFGPPDAGPASGSGYLFFLREGFSLADVGHDVFKLRGALIRDITALKKTLT